MVLRVTSVVSLLLGLLWFGSIFLRFLDSSGLVQGRSLSLVLSLCISIFLPRGLLVLLILNSCCCPTCMSIIRPLFTCIFSHIGVSARGTISRGEVCPLYSRAQHWVRPQNLVYGLPRKISLRERSLIKMEHAWSYQLRIVGPDCLNCWLISEVGKLNRLTAEHEIGSRTFRAPKNLASPCC